MELFKETVERYQNLKVKELDVKPQFFDLQKKLSEEKIREILKEVMNPLQDLREII